MSEETYGDLFDRYCRKFLSTLYDNRGRRMQMTAALLAEKLDGFEVSANVIRLHEEAARNAIFWGSRHGYAAMDEGEITVKEGDKNKVATARLYHITPAGIELLGHPIPGTPVPEGQRSPAA